MTAVPALLAPIRERHEATHHCKTYCTSPECNTELDRARLLAALDAVEDLAKYLDTLAEGDQHYANLFRAAVVAALQEGEK